ncbi:Leucine-rich repeat [Arabidopsis thaliana x Arabidopsis arenosa]|uniref:non-specific serine/threonine protein kinase n=1 Tax=Arabidopsis thaliana x Arabidopsis arenosa TaxID=1240361 RepID=A0A8T2C6E8_9BRAS|nr:Leucine-rich repeat [Arabidopsis thaliana x Arabidopsis arenosa]
MSSTKNDLHNNFSVDAIDRIKSRWGREKIDWEGDPCVPHEYMWNGLKCKYKHNKHPRIVSLNLTASGLIGEIPDTLSNLTSLEVLDLSNNNLTGSVPEFLADMESLKFINLSCNELNGLIIPKRLLDRAQKGLVTLSVDEFPGVCSSPSHATTSKKKTNIVVASVASTLFLILLIAAVIIVIYKRKRKADRHPSSENKNLQQWDQSSFSDIAQNVFTYEDLAQATGNFSSTNLIGQGGFGYVHRGVISDGTEVAIKQLKAGSRQGEQEFLAEIEIISRVHHKHLVSLLGYCITGCQRLLVYEFVPNKTLEFHLHEKEAPVMEWAKRMKIALGSAKGLSYLHDDCNPKTIHRDVKAANILIDNSYEPKLADFGLARSCSDTETHVSTRVMGTFGYLAPEYASSGKLTDKSDVFSFGVVLLELITGRRPFDMSMPFPDDESIVDWAKPLMTKALKDGNFDGFVDPRLENDFDVIEMTRVVACAAASVRHSAKRRPTMSQIVRVFEGNLFLDDVTDGTASEHSTSYSLDGSSDYCSTQYREDLKKFRKMALESHTFGSSGVTSENVQNSEPSGSSSMTVRLM